MKQDMKADQKETTEQMNTMIDKIQDIKMDNDIFKADLNEIKDTLKNFGDVKDSIKEFLSKVNPNFIPTESEASSRGSKSSL